MVIAHSRNESDKVNGSVLNRAAIEITTAIIDKHALQYDLNQFFTSIILF